MNQKEKPKDGRKLTDERILHILLIIYMLFFLSQTLLLRGSYERRANLTPFWTIRHALRGDMYRFQLLVINILLTVPIGYLAAAAAWKKKITDKRRIFAACVLLFVFVEAAQYATGRGLGEFDDVFHNSLGALCGMICFFGPLWTYDAMAVILTGGGMLQIVANELGMKNVQKVRTVDIQKYLMGQKGDKDLYDFYEELLKLRDYSL